jgi:hypothetical protein
MLRARLHTHPATALSTRLATLRGHAVLRVDREIDAAFQPKNCNTKFHCRQNFPTGVLSATEVPLDKSSDHERVSLIHLIFQVVRGRLYGDKTWHCSVNLNVRMFNWDVYDIESVVYATRIVVPPGTKMITNEGQEDPIEQVSSG